MSRRDIRVSVIMACHNSSAYLDEAVSSVLGQTLPDLELIVIDDCSTDNTLEIAARYQAQDDRVSVIRLSLKSGPAAARNAGIRAAKGEWLGTLDSDDVAMPERFEEQLTLADSDRGLVMIGSGVILIDEGGRVTSEHRYPTDRRELARRLYSYRGFMAHSSMMYRTKIAENLTLFNPRYPLAEDYDLWLRLSEVGEIACVDKPLVKLRKHQHNLSNAETEFWVFGYGAAICHFLRISGSDDPSRSNKEATWREFVTWVSRRLEEEGVVEKYITWADARAEYHSTRKGVLGAFRLGIRLLRSGHAGALVREQLLGTSLPKRLAHQWDKR